MDARSVIEGFRKLPRPEKIQLVQDLWEEIAEEASALPITDSQKRLLDERLRQHEENPDDVEAWAKVRDDVLREL